MADQGFLGDILKSLVDALKSRKTRRLEVFEGLVTERLKIVQATNRTFLEIIRGLANHLQQVDDVDQKFRRQRRQVAARGDQAQDIRAFNGHRSKALSAAMEALIDALTTAEATRTSGMTDRRSTHASARTFIDGEPLTQKGVAVVLNEHESALVQEFMANLAAYFQTGEGYRHELSGAILGCRQVVAAWNRKGEVDIAILSGAKMELDDAETRLHAKWSAVTTAYTRLEASVKFDMADASQLTRSALPFGLGPAAALQIDARIATPVQSAEDKSTAPRTEGR